VLLKETLNSAIDQLAVTSVGSPRMNAEILLMFTLGCDRAYLYAHAERELTSAEQTRYSEAIAQRARGMPAQYITGHQEFWGMDFIVSPAVLIPRPETEHVVETVLSKAADGGRASSPGFSPRIVDVGTGSGCIAVALAKELPYAELHATDISPAALEIARANAARYQLDRRIHFHHSDLLAGLARNSFDYVVSNPPYVGDSEEDQVQLEVRKFEPRNAVFSGPTGLEVIERLIPLAQAALQPDGWLVIEISGTIAAGIERLLRGWNQVVITKDLQGIARVASARRSAHD